MSVTLKQIAREVGVSQSLVTFALNNKPGVSEASRLKILEAAERLGYEKYANHQARALIARRYGTRTATGVIAFIYSITENHPWLDGPYNGPFVSGVEFETGLRDLDLYLAPGRQGRLPRIVREGGVDGVIVVAGPPDFPELGDLEVPVAFLCRHERAGFSLMPDNVTGTALAMDHLVELGHRHIAHLRPGLEFISAEDRRLGYLLALQRAGLPVVKEWEEVTAFSTIEVGQTGMARLLERRRDAKSGEQFTAVFCFNDNFAMGAIRAIQEQGLRVPEDISVVGFDDITAKSGFTPAVTSIAFSRYEMGRRAVDLVSEASERLVNGGDTGCHDAAKVEVFPVTLNVQDSTCPPPLT